LVASGTDVHRINCKQTSERVPDTERNESPSEKVACSWLESPFIEERGEERDERGERGERREERVEREERERRGERRERRGGTRRE